MTSAGVETRCAECEEPLPAVAKFCLACGAKVAAAPSLEMRKTVTLLFCDVSGSTALGEQLDPEALRAVMGRYFEVASAAVQTHGGTVEKFVGDAVLAVFGIPEVREDDALRAVRAAVQMRDDLIALSDELEASAGVRLAVRTGVNTGSVVAGAARAGGSFATGDAVNTAARLEQAAAPGEVLIGESTLSLVRDAVEVGDVQQLAVKGKADALPAYRLVRVLDTDRGRRRRLEASLVGRDRESRALLDALARTREDGRNQLLTVLGGAGMGKTRLVAQFLEDVGDDVQVLRARCLSYGRGITFWPVVQLLRQAASLSGEEDETTTRAALEQLLLGSPDAGAVVQRVLPLLGLGGEPGGNEETFWAVRAVLEHLAATRPTLVVLDDIHWAEPTLLDLVEQVRDEARDVPLLMLCLARPELLEARPGWGGGALNAQTFSLEPISAAQTSELLAGLLGPGVPSDAVAAIDAWAGGNPLFVEEVATHLVESGLLAFEGTWLLTGDLGTVQIPASVSALLAARLDRLPRDERALVERVSVIGLEFTIAEAAALAPAGVDAPALLASLGRRDVVRRTRGPRADTWAFRHVLVREAAYEANPKALRAELHERYADRLEAESLDAGGEGAAFVGHHLEQAARYRLELAPGADSTAAVARRAVAALTTAAEHAQELEDERASFGLVERALALHPTGDALLALHWLRVDLAMTQNQFHSAVASIATISELPEAAQTPATRAVLEAVELAVRSQAAEPIDPAVLRQAALRAAAIAAEAGDRAGQVRALKAGQTAYAVAARWEDMARSCDDIERFGTPADGRHARYWRLTAMQFGSMPATQALAATEEFLNRPGIGPFALGHGFTTKAVLLGMLGRHEEAAELLAAGEAQLLAVTGGVPSVVTFKRVQLRVSAGDVAGALASLGGGIEVLKAGGGLAYASTLIVWGAALLLEQEGNDAEAAAAVEEAASITSPYDVDSISLVEACRAVLAARRGDHDAAQLHLQRAREVRVGSDALVPIADMYRLLSEVPARAGDVDGQRTLLRTALELYRAKGHLPHAERTERMLADLPK